MRCQPHQSGEEVIAHPGKPAAASDGQKKGLATPTKTFLLLLPQHHGVDLSRGGPPPFPSPAGCFLWKPHTVYSG